jgi:hypothetical protein
MPDFTKAFEELNNLFSSEQPANAAANRSVVLPIKGDETMTDSTTAPVLSETAAAEIVAEFTAAITNADDDSLAAVRSAKRIEIFNNAMAELDWNGDPIQIVAEDSGISYVRNAYVDFSKERQTSNLRINLAKNVYGIKLNSDAVFQALLNMIHTLRTSGAPWRADDGFVIWKTPAQCELGKACGTVRYDYHGKYAAAIPQLADRRAYLESQKSEADELLDAFLVPYYWLVRGINGLELGSKLTPMKGTQEAPLTDEQRHRSNAFYKATAFDMLFSGSPLIVGGSGWKTGLTVFKTKVAQMGVDEAKETVADHILGSNFNRSVRQEIGKAKAGNIEIVVPAGVVIRQYGSDEVLSPEQVLGHTCILHAGERQLPTPLAINAAQLKKIVELGMTVTIVR